MLRVKAKLYSSYMMEYLLEHPGFLGFNMPFYYCLDKNIDINKFITIWEKIRRVHKELDGVFIKTNNDWYLEYKPKDLGNITKTQVKEEDIQKILHDSIEPFVPEDTMYRIKIFETEYHIYIFIDIYHALMDGTGRKNLTLDISRLWTGQEITESNYFDLIQKKEECNNEDDYLYFDLKYGHDLWNTLFKPSSSNQGPVKYMFIPFEERYNFNNSCFLSAILKTMAIKNKSEKVLVTWTFHSRKGEEEKRCYGLFMRDFPVGIIYKGQSLLEIYCDVKEQVKQGIKHMDSEYVMKKWADTKILYTSFQNDEYDIEPLLGTECKAEYLLDTYDELAEDTMIIEMRNDHHGCLLSFKYDSGMYKEDDIKEYGEMIKQFMLELVKEI